MSPLSVPPSSRKGRRFSQEFKARIVAACQKPGASVTRIALDNSLNANLVRRWISESRRPDSGRSPAFVPLNLPAPAEKQSVIDSSTIRIEIPRAGGSVVAEWPVDQAHQCVACYGTCCNEPNR